MPRKRKKIKAIVCILLLAALLLVAAVILLRLREYAAGANYYDSLRSP